MQPRHPPVPSPAAHASGVSSPAETDSSYDSEYNEKDAAYAARKDSARTDSTTASKQSVHAHTYTHTHTLPHTHAHAHAHAHDSVLSPFSPKPSAPPSPSSSSICSDRARKQRALASASVHETHGRRSAQSQRISYPPRAHLSQHDPEKASAYDEAPYSPRSAHRVSASPDAAAAVVYDKTEYHEKGPEDKAWQLLFFLSGPCALLSLLITLWTLLALLLTLFSYPLRLLTSRPSLSTQLTALLAPALNLQLHLVYSFNASTSYSVPMLLVIHLFSPVVALGVAVASWTAAGFWFFNSILGDPGGHDGGRHNDGRDCMLGVRGYWERWLGRALR